MRDLYLLESEEPLCAVLFEPGIGAGSPQKGDGVNGLHVVFRVALQGTQGFGGQLLVGSLDLGVDLPEVGGLLRHGIYYEGVGLLGDAALLPNHIQALSLEEGSVSELGEGLEVAVDEVVGGQLPLFGQDILDDDPRHEVDFGCHIGCGCGRDGSGVKPAACNLRLEFDGWAASLSQVSDRTRSAAEIAGTQIQESSPIHSQAAGRPPESGSDLDKLLN